MPRVKGVKPNTILRHLIISWGWPPGFVERDDTWSPSPGDHNVVVHIKCHDNRNNLHCIHCLLISIDISSKIFNAKLAIIGPIQ